MSTRPFWSLWRVWPVHSGLHDNVGLVVLVFMIIFTSILVLVKILILVLCGYTSLNYNFLPEFRWHWRTGDPRRRSWDGRIHRILHQELTHANSMQSSNCQPSTWVSGTLLPCQWTDIYITRMPLSVECTDRGIISPPSWTTLWGGLRRGYLLMQTFKRPWSNIGGQTHIAL